MAIVATNKSTSLLDGIRELARYRDEDPVATAFNVGNSFFATNEQWRRAVEVAPPDSDNFGCGEYRAPGTPAEIMEHYRRCVPQVEQQVFATYGISGEIALRERIVAMVEPGMTVLDFGAGIGSQLVPLVAKGCRCVHVDVGGVMMDYASWRYQQLRPARGPTGPSCPSDGPSYTTSGGVDLIALRDDYMEVGVPNLRGRTFDVVICTEVIEHVTEPEKFVEKLAQWVKPGGLCVATTSFDDGDGMVPMHLNIDKYDDESFAAEVFPRYGLVPFEESFYRKRS